MTPIRSICGHCFESFSDSVGTHPEFSGSLNVYCEHHFVLLATEVVQGVVAYWNLSPAANRDTAQKVLSETLEQWRNDVPLLLQQTPGKKH
jgi:hypothetical protein